MTPSTPPNGAEPDIAASGVDLLLTQMQETGRIRAGMGIDLGWLLGFLGELGIDPALVYIDVANGWIEVDRG